MPVYVPEVAAAFECPGQAGGEVVQALTRKADGEYRGGIAAASRMAMAPSGAYRNRIRPKEQPVRTAGVLDNQHTLFSDVNLDFQSTRVDSQLNGIAATA